MVYPINPDLIRAAMKAKGEHYDAVYSRYSLPFICPLCEKEKPNPQTDGSTMIYFKGEGEYFYAARICQQCLKKPMIDERERIHVGIARSGGCRTTPGIIAGPFTCPSCGETRQAPKEYAGGVWYESADGSREHVCICEECSRKYDPAMRRAEE